jgi:uncharacterized protein (DUF302 family)
MEDYLILGACNPPLAHRAVNVDRQVGLLLPCNVVVRADAGQNAVIVDAMNPQLMVQLVDRPGMREVADEVTTKPQSNRSSSPAPPGDKSQRIVTTEPLAWPEGQTAS